MIRRRTTKNSKRHFPLNVVNVHGLNKGGTFNWKIKVNTWSKKVKPKRRVMRMVFVKPGLFPLKYRWRTENHGGGNKEAAIFVIALLPVLREKWWGEFQKI